MVTIKDIADMANVSRGTVDRVLNNRGGVNPRTAERIRLIAEKLNYTPSASARGLAVMKKELKFGFVMDSVCGTDSAISRAMVRKKAELEKYNITVLSRIYTIEQSGELLRAIDELEAEGVSGIAMLPVPSPEVEQRVRQLMERGIPVVTFSNDLPTSGRLAFVGCDYYRNGMTLAGLTRMLLGEDGKIAILSGSLTARYHGRRIQGMLDRLAEDRPGIRCVAQVVCEEDDFSAYAAGKQLLEAHPDLDLLVLNIVSTFGSLRAIQEQDRHIHILSTNRISEMEPYLENETVDAVVSHQPWIQTDLSLDILFQYLVWGKKPGQEIFYTNNEVLLTENKGYRKLTP